MKFLKILANGALLCLCITSCRDKIYTEGPVGCEGSIYESFVQIYIYADEMELGEEYRGFLYVSLEGEEIEQNYLPNDKGYGELSAKYGDTGYNQKIVLPNEHEVLADDFTSIDIRSDRDFDAGHKAGESLADIVTLLATSPAKFIESGYTDAYDWMFKPMDYTITSHRFMTYGYWPVTERLDRLTPEDLLLISPSLSLKFESFPLWEKTHNITVTFKSAEKELSAETEVTFP